MPFGPRVQSRVSILVQAVRRYVKGRVQGVLLTLFDVRDELHSIREHRAPHHRRRLCPLFACWPFGRLPVTS